MNDFIKPYFKYAQFTGRADRKEFWYFVLFYFIASAILTILDGMLFGGARFTGEGMIGYSTSGPLAAIFGIASLIPSVAVAVRRLHDTGKSGWLVLLCLIPVLGWIVLIVFYAQKGQPETNAHGEPPAGSLPARAGLNSRG